MGGTEVVVEVGVVKGRILEGFEERFLVAVLLCCGEAEVEAEAVEVNDKEGKVKDENGFEGKVLRVKDGERKEEETDSMDAFTCKL